MRTLWYVWWHWSNLEKLCFFSSLVSLLVFAMTVVSEFLKLVFQALSISYSFNSIQKEKHSPPLESTNLDKEISKELGVTSSVLKIIFTESYRWCSHFGASKKMIPRAPYTTLYQLVGWPSITLNYSKTTNTSYYTVKPTWKSSLKQLEDFSSFQNYNILKYLVFRKRH